MEIHTHTPINSKYCITKINIKKKHYTQFNGNKNKSEHSLHTVV